MAEGISNEVQLEALHKTLLETLDGEQRAQLVKSMEEPEKAFRSTMQQQDDEMQDVEQVCCGHTRTDRWHRGTFDVRSPSVSLVAHRRNCRLLLQTTKKRNASSQTLRMKMRSQTLQ